MNDSIYFLLFMPGALFTGVFFLLLRAELSKSNTTLINALKSFDKVLLSMGVLGILCLSISLPKVYSQISREIQLETSITELKHKSRAHQILVSGFYTCLYAPFKSVNECIIEMRQMADVHQLNEEFAVVLEDLQPILDDFHNQDE